MKWISVVFGLVVFSLVLGTARPVAAFECPNQFKAAAAEIGKAVAAVKGLSGQKKKEAHILLDDAKMWLASARHNHAKPQGRLDHGRAVAKAITAAGYAKAAVALANS